MDDLVRWVLGEFSAQHRELAVTLEQLNAFDVVQAVAADAASCGVAYCVAADPAVDVVQSRPLPVLAAMRADHPCAALPEPLNLADVARHPVAMMTAGFGLHGIVRRAASAEGVRLQPVLATNSLATLRQFVLAGLGVSFMSRLAAGPDLVVRRMASPVLNAADVRLLVRAGRDLSPAMTELLRFLRVKSAAWAA